MASGIYAIKNIVTKKYYIGSTRNFKKRWSEHKYHLKRGTHHSLKLQRSYDKHGLASFEFSILKEVEEPELLEEIEKEFIELYEAWQSGYNVLKRGAKLTDYEEGSIRNVSNGAYVTREKIAKSPEDDKERLSVRLAVSRLQKLRRIASQREKTMTQLIEDWIDTLKEEKLS
jgi:group I intron endonuclease